MRGEGVSKSGFASAVKGVQEELSNIGGDGASMAERVELLRAKIERQKMATALWSAAYADDGPSKEGATPLPTEAPESQAEPPNQNRFIAICCLFKLVIIP